LLSDIPALHLKDAYKFGHPFQYPDDTTLVYSNMTARASRVLGSKHIVPFGTQYLAQEYFVDHFRRTFFDQPKDVVLAKYERRAKRYLGGLASYQHIADLHDLGYLPIHVKAVPEGTLVPMRVPFFTIRNTKPEFYWVTNMLETLISNVLWLPCTSATTAYLYRLTFERYAKVTGGDLSMVKFQGHDFSMRGLAGIESACLSGAAHMLSFWGTDTTPAIDFLEMFYDANVHDEPVGLSVPATEHSVMSMGGRANELATIRRLVTVIYPSKIISIVCDTWDFWRVLTEYLPQLKAEILARDGKVVVRPDSGDPVKIICGDPDAPTVHERAGAIETLWRTFGGTTDANGYRTLDPHVGLIYGDSITLERQTDILDGLMRRKFVSTIPVLGIGSYTYQYTTRDTYGQAIKATYGERTSTGPQAIYKDPKTDNGVKKSATGLLCVQLGTKGELECHENASWDEEGQGCLQSVFMDGKAIKRETLAGMRARIDAAIARDLGVLA
jgi:nicotinamide phosphoribosyltransferase